MTNVKFYKSLLQLMIITCIDISTIRLARYST